MKSHDRPTSYGIHRVDVLLPRQVVECTRKKDSKSWSVLHGKRFPRIVVFFICASIPLCFRQYSVDPYRHSRHLLLLREDSAYYNEMNTGKEPLDGQRNNLKFGDPNDQKHVHVQGGDRHVEITRTKQNHPTLDSTRFPISSAQSSEASQDVRASVIKGGSSALESPKVEKKSQQFVSTQTKASAKERQSPISKLVRKRRNKIQKTKVS